MASLIKKIIRGRPYYYARQCKRVDGKPKIVWQKYLGRPQDIIDAVTGPAAPGAPAQPKEADVSDFGAIAALYDLATRLRIVECIDRHVFQERRRSDGRHLPARRRHQPLRRAVQQGEHR